MRTKIFLPLIIVLYSLGQFGWAGGQTNPPGEVAAQQPPWQVCNETSFVLDIASVTMPDAQSARILVSQGWIKLRPGACQAVAARKGAPRFVYARSASFHQGGIRQWQGPHNYCVAADNYSFSIGGDCQAQNLSTANFLRIIPTEQRTAFVEPADYGKKAQMAGLQRLLIDNNYALPRIDGIDGRRTMNLLDTFLEKQNLGTTISAEAKYEALEQAALASQPDIGVSFCNNSEARIWTAIGTLEDEGWKSTGWWPVEPQACVQVYNSSLLGKQAHYYARQENAEGRDKILNILSGAARELCIGEARFSAYTHGFCEDRGYVVAKFKALAEDEAGVVINLQDLDFHDASLNELR